MQIMLNDKKGILKYKSLHNPLEKEYDTTILIAKHNIKNEKNEKVQFLWV